MVEFLQAFGLGLVGLVVAFFAVVIFLAVSPLVILGGLFLGAVGFGGLFTGNAHAEVMFVSGVLLSSLGFSVSQATYGR